MSRSFHSIARRRARNLTETRDWIRLRLSRQMKEAVKTEAATTEDRGRMTAGEEQREEGEA